MPWRSLRAACRLAIRRGVELQVEGLEHLPTTGGVLIAARHFHHLYDGAALFTTIDRPTSVIVGLDWIRSSPLKKSMMAACRAAGWPVVYRSHPVHPVPEGEARRLLLRATRDTVARLKDGQIVVVFPEAYPNIDPGYTPKPDRTAFLPFEPGVVRLGQIANRSGSQVPIIPVGFEYTESAKWLVTLRFGAPIDPGPPNRTEETLQVIESAVRELSRAT